MGPSSKNRRGSSDVGCRATITLNDMHDEKAKLQEVDNKHAGMSKEEGTSLYNCISYN